MNCLDALSSRPLQAEIIVPYDNRLNVSDLVKCLMSCSKDGWTANLR
jgi:hypothetical protein